MTLTNGRTFYTKYKTVRKNLLPDSIRIRKSNIRGSLAKAAIENVPEIYKKGIVKIKNKKLQKILNSDLANTALDYGRAYA